MIYNDPNKNCHFTMHPSNLSDEEIASICAYGDGLEKIPVRLFGKHDESHVRAKKSAITRTDETAWLFDKVFKMAEEINNDNYGYDLTNLEEYLYYITYENGEHFNWHLDIGEQTPEPRKLSLVIQLSDPSEYEGGEFDVMIARSYGTAQQGKGLVTAFPSFKIHRVRPIISGTRRVLTAFACGPNFR